ncbi:MAG: RnfH family protein [Burkholderiales bacterium]|nr:RnfH family protein [Burkholderiales bacterium]
MKVSVAYALPHRQIVRELEVAEGSTVADALRGSGLLQDFPAIDPVVTKVGIYGKTASWDEVLQPGDRVEIYRPLNIDAKNARRERGRKS